jgi:hypothetical protein
MPCRTGRPPSALSILTIASLIHITSAKTGTRIGMKGEGCRTMAWSSLVLYLDLFVTDVMGCKDQ